MNTDQFLARVVAPGNFIAIAFLTSKGGMAHRFFRREDVAGAAGMMAWCVRKQIDCWYAVASYKLASPDTKGNYQGKRTQDNTQALKAFWVDIDVKREGDKKDPAKVYADLNAAVLFLKGFLAATKIPQPNLWVHSGYGLHVYWVLEDALAPADWQPYADALKAALIQHGAVLDAGLSADSARILRVPGTFNLKNPATPAAVYSLDQLSRGDYPNELVLDALQPYVGVMPAARAVGQSYGAGLAGSPPAVFKQRQNAGAMTQIAQDGPTNRRDHFFARIGERCEQVKASLANQGAGDEYPLWYLGHLSLASFCTDGQDFIHEIGRGDARYDAAATDAAYQRAQAEHARKGTGAPTCSHYERARPGVCRTCPHYGRINTPYTLGVEDGAGDLPDDYRRSKYGLERCTYVGKGEDMTVSWVPVVGGDVYGPLLDKVGDNRKLTFTYERGGSRSTVSILQSDVPTDASGAVKYFGAQGVTGLYTDNANHFGKFIVAWIEKLRDLRAEREQPVPAFGWVQNGDTYKGFAVGGTCYRSDGVEEAAPGGDKLMVEHYRPRGKLEGWKAAADFALTGRPDLQVLVAAAFGAPLVEFTGHNGFVMSAWSRDSAVGKSSALIIGTTVWADPLAMFNLGDTANSTVYRIGKMRAVPAYWDEIQLGKEDEDKFVTMLFQLSQGKEKSRLNSDSTLKESGDWKTMLIATGNRPLMDVVVKRRADTDAGAVRLFEFVIDHPQMPLDAQAQKTISSAGNHAGNAGRLYASWLAQNADAASALVAAMQKKLEQALSPVQSERYYVAGMACLMAGAAIAKGLGLFQFDTVAMQEILKTAFAQLREGRQANLPIGAGAFDIERVLADFISDHAAQRLLTKTFLRPGPGQEVTTVWQPRDMRGRLAIHVGQFEHRMRVDRTIWRNWCYNRGISPSDASAMLERRWNAQTKRLILGAGTDHATGRVDVIEIPLVVPELDEYNYSYDSKGKKP